MRKNLNNIFNIVHSIGLIFIVLGFVNENVINIGIINTINNMFDIQINFVIFVNLISIGFLIIAISYIIRYFTKKNHK